MSVWFWFTYLVSSCSLLYSDRCVPAHVLHLMRKPVLCGDSESDGGNLYLIQRSPRNTWSCIHRYDYFYVMHVIEWPH